MFSHKVVKRAAFVFIFCTIFLRRELLFQPLLSTPFLPHTLDAPSLGSNLILSTSTCRIWLWVEGAFPAWCSDLGIIVEQPGAASLYIFLPDSSPAQGFLAPRVLPCHVVPHGSLGPGLRAPSTGMHKARKQMVWGGLVFPLLLDHQCLLFKTQHSPTMWNTDTWTRCCTVLLDLWGCYD